MVLAENDPIFIVGIMPRSGTNYLWDLLCAHPGCAPAREPIREDFFLQESDHLVAFMEGVRRWWDERWGVFPADLMASFRRSLGDGLISFLRADPSRRLVTKTPSVTRLARFFSFFPQARLIILIRDGRSVVQSAMTTFGWNFDRAAREWAAAADEIRSFQSHHRHLPDRYMTVRYEDLIEDVEGSLRGMFRFLDLKETGYDFEMAGSMPVRGSSFYLGPGHDSVHWEPVEKGPDFAPKERWRSWSTAMHLRFEWIAGEQLRSLGYRSLVPPIARPLDVIQHRVLDSVWHVDQVARTLVYRARITIGTATRPLRERLRLVRTSSPAPRIRQREDPDRP